MIGRLCEIRCSHGKFLDLVFCKHLLVHVDIVFMSKKNHRRNLSLHNTDTTLVRTSHLVPGKPENIHGRTSLMRIPKSRKRQTIEISRAIFRFTVLIYFDWLSKWGLVQTPRSENEFIPWRSYCACLVSYRNVTNDAYMNNLTLTCYFGSS